MAKKIAVDYTINSEGAAKSLKEIKQEYRENISALSGLVEGTKEYQQQLKKIADSRDEIDDLNESVAAMTGAGKFGALANVGTTLASGFQAAQGAMALFGAEGKALEETLLKVQAASAFAEGLKGLEGIGDALKNAKAAAMDLWKTLIANPYMLVLAAVVAATVAIGKWIQSMNTAKTEAERLEDQYQALKKANEGLVKSIDTEITALEGLNKNEKQIIELKKQKLKLLVEEEKAGLRAALAQAQAVESQYKAWEQLSKAEKLALEQLGLNFESYTNQRREALNKLNERQLAFNQRQAELQGFLNTLEQKRIDDSIEAAKKAQEAQDKKLQNELDAIGRKKELEADAALSHEQFLQQLKEYDDAKEDEDELRRQREIDAENEKNAAIIQASLDQKAKEDQIQAERLARRKLFVEQVKQSEESLFSIANSLAILATNNEKKQAEIQKKIALAKLAIDTAKAISGAVAQAQSVPFPGNIVAIAAGVAAVLANIAQAKQMLQSADTSGGGSFNVSGGGSTSTFDQGALTTGVNNTSTNLSTLNNDDGKKMMQPVVKAVVVQTELQLESEKLKAAENKSKVE